MPEVHLNVTLIRHTLSPEELVALGARLCYSRATIGNLQEKISAQDQAGFVARLLDMGHDSVLEHASFTFGVEGVSRVLLAQLTRHRLASFSVQSQRYVSYEKGFGYIVPPRIAALGAEAQAEYTRQMEQLHAWYTGWQERLGAGEGGNEDARFLLPGACETRLMVTMNVRELRHFFSLRMCRRAQWEMGAGEGGNEDARFLLPGACETRLMVTMNVRELRHFFSLRMCRRAQWEIRALATEMHRLCMEIAPALFQDAGAPCLTGPCPEGEKCCGSLQEIRRERQELLDALSQADVPPQP